MKPMGITLKNDSVVIIGTRGYPSYYGGFETAVRKLAPYLAGRGWDVTVYGRPGTTRKDDPGIDQRVKTVETIGLETRSLSTLTYGFTSVLHAVLKKPDVALVMNVANGFWLPLLKARGIRTVVNVDGIEWDRAKWSTVAKAVFRAGARMTARYADEIVVDSLEIGRRWKQDFGVTGTFIPYGGDEAGDLPVEPGLTHGQYILVVARFVPENTIPEFLEAVPTLAESWPVVIVGSSGYGGELEETVRALSEASTNVHWFGHVADDARLLALWQHSGAYFHGHSVGGTNPALVQAIACGAPVVARDTVYNREVLGSNALFVAPNSVAIAGGLSAVMAAPGEAAARAHVAKKATADRYAWTTISESYHNALLGQTRAQLKADVVPQLR